MRRIGGVEVERYGVEDGNFGALALAWSMFTYEVLVAAPPAEEVLDRARFTQVLDEGRYLGREQGIDETSKLLLALVDYRLIGPKQECLLAELGDVVVDIE